MTGENWSAAVLFCTERGRTGGRVMGAEWVWMGGREGGEGEAAGEREMVVEEEESRASA